MLSHTLKNQCSSSTSRACRGHTTAATVATAAAAAITAALCLYNSEQVHAPRVFCEAQVMAYYSNLLPASFRHCYRFPVYVTKSTQQVITSSLLRCYVPAVAAAVVGAAGQVRPLAESICQANCAKPAFAGH
eukprot:11197-Heterococcus_DN1.PRE.1